MVDHNRPVISREGFVYIAASLVFVIVLQHEFGFLMALPAWLFVGFLLFLFRDPKRKVPSAPLGIICPVDGVVEAIGKRTDTYLDRPAIRIVVRMRFFGCRLVRSPIEGRIAALWARSALKKMGSGHYKPRYALHIQTDEKDDVMMINCSPIKQGLRCYYQAGERMGQGRRSGFNLFPARIVLYLPENSKMHTSVGSKVMAGTDIIATLNH